MNPIDRARVIRTAELLDPSGVMAVAVCDLIEEVDGQSACCHTITDCLNRLLRALEVPEHRTALEWAEALAAHARTVNRKAGFATFGDRKTGLRIIELREPDPVVPTGPGSWCGVWTVSGERRMIQVEDFDDKPHAIHPVSRKLCRVTDPALVTWIVDPADPSKVLRAPSVDEWIAARSL